MGHSYVKVNVKYGGPKSSLRDYMSKITRSRKMRPKGILVPKVLTSIFVLWS